MNEKSENIEKADIKNEDLLGELVERVGKVRRRLVIEPILKTLAMGLIVLPVYVACYAWIDHRFHLGPILRLVALVLLVFGVGWLLLYWAKIFLSHVSLSRAANYIESNCSYQQQLVAAIEYYEQQTDYPYSHRLAEQMIRQIHQESQEQNFVNTIRKWPSIISACVILCAAICMLFLIGNHFQYYSRYFLRLVKPVSVIKPLPPTELSSISGDIIAEPDEALTLIATIEGRKPESANLIIESETVHADPNDGVPEQRMSIPLLASTNKENQPVFNAQMSLHEKGNYHYYFQSGEATSSTHTIRITEFPKIQSVTAEIMVSDSLWVKPYTEEVENLSLAVFQGSYVTLKIKTNQPLEDVQITLPDKRDIESQLQKPDMFTVAFNAKEAGKIEFRMTNTEGLKSREATVLRLNLKEDNCPEFKLLSPTGDYIASNVASIPIEFEISDDFALQSASLNLEFNDGEIIRVPVEGLKQGSRTANISFLLELEEYDLDISDSIIFYAVASDVDTGIGIANQTAWSTPYFVEIRPYRKLIKQPPPSLPSMEKQGMKQPAGHEPLMAILEYNRAFLKKTWALSQKSDLQQQDKSRLTAISDDVEYTGGQLSIIRDDPGYQFTEEQIGVINDILSNYDHAAKTLVKYKPKQALPPEKQAYHEVRALIRELMECPPPVAGMKPETRDKLELKDSVHVTRFEKERIEWQLEKIAQELAELAKEQDKLQTEFVKFLEEQKKNKLEQEVTDAESWTEKHETELQRVPPSDRKPAMTENDTSVQGAMVNLKNPPPSAGSGGQKTPHSKEKQKNSEEQTAQKQQEDQNQSGQGSLNNQQLIANEMLRIMRAQQKTLQKQLNELSNQLANVPIPDEPIDGNGTESEDIRQAAQEHLANAREAMDHFEAELVSQYYNTDISEESLVKAEEHLNAALQEMNLAGLEMAKEYASYNQQLAMRSENLAKHLEELADAYEQSMSEAEKNHLEQLLQQATELLEAMPKDWWKGSMDTDIQVSDSAPRQRNMQQTQGPVTSRTGNGGFHSGGRQEAALSSAAREKAKQFWSIAIKTRQKASQLSKTQYSHPEFIDEENRFFEKTASYGVRQEKP